MISVKDLIHKLKQFDEGLMVRIDVKVPNYDYNDWHYITDVLQDSANTVTIHTVENN